MTNEEIVRAELTTERLARLLIKRKENCLWNFDADDDPHIECRYDFWITSDGGAFTVLEEAVAHEIKWLQKEVEGKNGYLFESESESLWSLPVSPIANDRR